MGGDVSAATAAAEGESSSLTEDGTNFNVFAGERSYRRGG